MKASREPKPLFRFDVPGAFIWGVTFAVAFWAIARLVGGGQ